MKKIFLLILSGLGVVILLTVVAAGIVLNLDPNRYKDYVAEKISQQLGRTFEITGDLRVEYYPWLHLEMSGIFLENAPEFDDVPLLTADHVMVRVKTLPLLGKQIEMDTIVLEGVHVNLARNKAGVSNWGDPGGTPDTTGPDKPSEPSSKKGFDLKNLAVLLTGGVRIQDTSFSFDDQSTGKKYAVSDLNLACRVEMDLQKDTVSVRNLTASGLGTDVTGTILLGNMSAAIPRVDMDLDIAGNDLALLLQIIEGGPLSAHLAQTGQKTFHVNMDVDVDVSQGRILVPALDIAALGITLKGDVAARGLGTSDANLDGQIHLEGRHLNRLFHALDQPVPGDLLDTVAGQVRFNGKQGNLTLDPLQVRLGLAGKMISGGPVSVTLDAPVHWQMDQQRLELPAFSVSGMDLAVSGSLAVEKIQTSPEYSGALSVAPFNLRQLMKKLAIPLPETTDARVFEKVGLETRFAGSTNDIRLTGLSGVLDDSQLNGSLGVTDFSDPDITMDLAVDRIDVDRYLPKAPRDAKGKKQKSVPVTPETVAAGAVSEVPVAQLRNLKINAALAIDDLVVSGASLSKVQAKLIAKDGVIHAAPLSATLYNGVYEGNVMLNAAGDLPLLTMDSTLKGIEVEPLLMDMTGKAMIRGTGDVTTALTTRGATVTAMKRQLNGNLSFSFQNGAVKGFNAGKFLRSLKSLRDNRSFSVSEEEETDFTELTGNPVVTNGVVVLNDLSGKSPALRVSGTGTIVDIVQEIIDYKAVLTVVETSTGQAGKEMTELAGLPIPVYIKGPLADPSIRPDIKGVITSILSGTSSDSVEQLKQSVEKELGRFLKKFSN